MCGDITYRSSEAETSRRMAETIGILLLRSKGGRLLNLYDKSISYIELTLDREFQDCPLTVNVLFLLPFKKITLTENFTFVTFSTGYCIV